MMRSLALADALKSEGASCHFVCRDHPGLSLDLITERGHGLKMLPPGRQSDMRITDGSEPQSPYAEWLGCHWSIDAEQTQAALQSLDADWLVVDHYALDARWEQTLIGCYRKLMVIDDLADRPHHCDLLLDQNLGRDSEAYANLIPSGCTSLIGPQYALLRPSFAALRNYSIQRRKQPQLGQLLVTLGGVDQLNATGAVIDALARYPLPPDCRIIIVMGRYAPHLRQVQEQAANMPWPCEVKINVNNMAQLMADSDLAIGAAGSTSWERCCLGLPTVILALADNQRDIAVALDAAGAARLVAGDGLPVAQSIPAALLQLAQKGRLSKMAEEASKICDGRGVERVIQCLNG